MRCISRSITLLASLALGLARDCAVVDGPRVRAADLAPLASVFVGVPGDTDLGPAPSGSMVRIYTREQLAVLAGGSQEEMPAGLCVERRRAAIPEDDWRASVDRVFRPPCLVSIGLKEYPRHRYPGGELVFSAAGLAGSSGGIWLWRGALVLPEKSSIPVWVRVTILRQGRRQVLREAKPMGSVLGAGDFTIEEGNFPVTGSVCGEASAFSPIGMVARRNLKAGAEVARGDVRRPPAVNRGQSIEVETGAGNSRLRLQAVAENDAGASVE